MKERHFRNGQEQPYPVAQELSVQLLRGRRQRLAGLGALTAAEKQETSAARQIRESK
jgi:hypothetical protein